MERKLKVGIIGLGKMCHMPIYQNMDNVEVVAICDILPEKIAALKEKFALGDEVLSFTDYNDLLNVEGLDFVDISTPNYLHSIIAVAALDKGIHVFTEKPDAISTEEAEKMMFAAQRSGKHLMAMRNNRYRGNAKYLKQYIADGKMGEIYCGRCGWLRRRGVPGKGGWFTTKEQSGGGPLIDLGVHMLDLAIWLMGNPTPVAVTGCTYRKFADNDVSESVDASFGEKVSGGTFDVEDLAMGFIRFDNGACLQVETSWASNIEKDELFVELRGTKAGFKFSSLTGTKIFTEDNGHSVDVVPVFGKDPSMHAENIKHFVDVLLNGTEPEFKPIQGVNMIKIIDALYRSAELGHEIIL